MSSHFFLHSLPCLFNALYHSQDTGAPITPDLIASYIKDSSPSVTKIAGVTEKHLDIAVKYLQSEVDKAVKGQWPSEFLTSDLMGYLDAPGTAKL